MDIDKALAELRDLVGMSLNNYDDETLAYELAEKIRDIDEWLTRGGYKPRPWQ